MTVESSPSAEEHRFLFLQVPFHMVLGCDVFMIIKVFNTFASKGACEHDYVWTPDRASSKDSRNIHRIYEGFGLVDISSAVWKNMRCGQTFKRPVQFCKVDKVQVVDDRYLQIYRELNFEKHKEL